MKHMYNVVLLFVVSLIACSSETESDDLVIFENEDIIIELLNVEDSRCPLEVTCVWEGDAAVFLSITGQDDTAEFTLNSNPNATNSQVEVVYSNYTIKLLDVSPYPKSTTPVGLDEYVISLDVKKL